MRVFLIVLIAFFFNRANAQVIINVKYGDNVYNGNGVAGGGTNWNYFNLGNGATKYNLLASTGIATSISVSTTFYSLFGGGSAVGVTPDFLLGSGKYGPCSLTLSGLDPLALYNLYIYVYNKSSEVATAVTVSTPGGGSFAPSPNNILNSFELNKNYVLFTGLTANQSGQILASVGGPWSGLNGIQLQVVPEPHVLQLSVAGFMLLGVVCIFRRASVVSRG